MFKNLIKKIFTPLNLIILAALFIRIFQAYKLGDFNWDEMFSITFSQKPWGDSWRLWLLETNPPLHMILLKLYWYLWPSASFLSRHLEIIARSFSIVTSTISIYLLYRLVNKNFDKNTALTSATILSFSILHIAFSTTTRGYALLIMLQILSLDYFCDYFIKDIKQKNILVKLIVVNGLALFTHLTAVIFIFSELAYLIGLKKEKAKEYFTKHLFVFLPIGIWYVISIFAKLPLNNLGRAWFFNLKPGFSFLCALSSFRIMPLENIYLALLLFIFVMVGTIWQIKLAVDKIQHIKQYGVFILIWLATICFIIFTQLYDFKFYFIALSSFVILLADLLNKLPIKKWWLPIILILMLGNSTISYLAQNDTQNWQKMVDEINSKNTDKKTTTLIIADTDEILTAQRYLHTNFKYFVYNIDKYSEKELDTKLVRENYIFVKSSEKEINTWLTKNTDNQYKDVFILESLSKQIGLVDQIKKHGYILKEILDKAPIEGDQLIYWYEKN